MIYPHGGYSSGDEATELPVVPEGPAQGFCVCPGPTEYAKDCGIAEHREIARSTIDMNSRRKRREGIRDKGLCPCGIYVQISCRTYCMRTGERHG